MTSVRRIERVVILDMGRFVIDSDFGVSRAIRHFCLRAPV